MRLKFKAFRAIDESYLCIKYKEGHQNVLKDYGITNVTTNNSDWMSNPNVYCIVALMDNEDEVVGGIRIQISDDKNLLPVESAIGKMDNRIHSIVNRFRNEGGVGELCALWNAKSIAGLGISLLLTRAGIALTNQVQIKTLMGICADYTLKMFKQVGFVVENSLGTDGSFPYPNASYTARVLGIMNAESLETAHEFDKQRMSSIRTNPIQTAFEKAVNEEIEVKYNLLLNQQ